MYSYANLHDPHQPIKTGRSAFARGGEALGMPDETGLPQSCTCGGGCPRCQARSMANALSGGKKMHGMVADIKMPDPAPVQSPQNHQNGQFASCSTAQTHLAKAGIAAAKRLARGALLAVESLLNAPDKKAFKANPYLPIFKKHFGKPTQARLTAVANRLFTILQNVDSAKFRCGPCPTTNHEEHDHEEDESSTPPVDGFCAMASCPGNDILLCPPYFNGPPACYRGQTILHEAAHNAGACLDVRQGKKYPPANAEDNAYSYGGFGRDVALKNGAWPP